MKSRSILVTGGAGFIGKSLVKYLLEKHGDEITQINVFDNFISSNKDEFIEFQRKYDSESKVILFEYDITNIKDMMFVKHNFAFDEIYHLASLASPPFYKKFPLETLEVGYTGTKNVLEIARYQNSTGTGYTQNRNCKVLFTSTSEVYGDPNVSPQSEDYYGNVNTFGSRSSYDESKRVAEALCYSYINLFDLDVKVARIFNTYGPEMMINDGRIVTQCIKSLMNKSTLEIYGTGEQTRSLCYSSCCVNQLVQLMASDCNIPVNIGNDTELTVNQIVDTIERIYRQNFDENAVLTKSYIPLTQNDPLKRRPLLERNKQTLGERKYVSLDDGIYETIEFFVGEPNMK